VTSLQAMKTYKKTGLFYLWLSFSVHAAKLSKSKVDGFEVITCERLQPLSRSSKVLTNTETFANFVG